MLRRSCCSLPLPLRLLVPEEDGGDFCSFVPPSSVSGSGWWQLRFTQKLACQAMALPRRSASVMGVMSSKGIHASPSKRLPRLA